MAQANNPDTVDRFLSEYRNILDTGFGLLTADVNFLASVLIAISLTFSGLFWAFNSQGADVAFLKKVLMIGFFSFLLNNWSGLVNVVSDSFVELGLRAGGGSLTRAEFFSPSAIASIGVDFWVEFGESINALSGPIAFFNNFGEIAIVFLAGLVVLVAFFVIALQIFATIVAFKLGTIATFILVPFGLLKHTNFMSERALGWVASYGIKFLALAIVVSLGYNAMSGITISSPIPVGQALELAFLSVIFMWMAISGPSLASELITGGPQIGAGSLAGAGLASAAIAGGAVLGAAKLAKGGAQIANPLLKAATSSNAGNISINGDKMSSNNSASDLNSFKKAPRGGGSGGANPDSGAASAGSSSAGSASGAGGVDSTDASSQSSSQGKSNDNKQIGSQKVLRLPPPNSDGGGFGGRSLVPVNPNNNGGGSGGANLPVPMSKGALTTAPQGGAVSTRPEGGQLARAPNTPSNSGPKTVEGVESSETQSSESGRKNQTQDTISTFTPRSQSNGSSRSRDGGRRGGLPVRDVANALARNDGSGGISSTNNRHVDEDGDK